MLRFIAGAVLGAVTFSASADCVSGYVRKDGTYVQGYCRSTPNASRYDNFGSQTMGGTQRDEFSRTPAFNRSSPSWTYGDNDNDGTPNSIDNAPERKW